MEAFSALAFVLAIAVTMWRIQVILRELMITKEFLKDVAVNLRKVRELLERESSR